MNFSGPELQARPIEPVPAQPHAVPRQQGSGRAEAWGAATLDFAVAMSAVHVATAVAGGASIRDSGVALHQSGLAMALLAVSTFCALGLYGQSGFAPCFAFRQRAIGALLVAVAGGLSVMQADGWLAAVGWAVVCSGLLLIASFYAHLALVRFGVRTSGGGVTAALIGTGEEACAVARGLLEHPEMGLRPVGFVVLPDRPPVGVELPLPVLCRLEHAAQLEPGVELAVLTGSSPEPKPFETQFGHLPFNRVLRITDMRALHALRLRPDAVQANGGNEEPTAARQARLRLCKRGMDIALTLPVALVALPIAGLAILAVKLADPGPAIFVHSRVGLGGRRFDVYKIRSMYRDADQRLETCLANDPQLAAEWRAHFKLDRDPRILPGIGNMLRRWSLDELPQLWNVLKGDMSLVGPRPFPAYHLECFDPAFQVHRQSVMPGLTGLWQISARSNGDLAVQKQQDVHYIDNWSLWLDFKILLETPIAVMRGEGAK